MKSGTAEHEQNGVTMPSVAARTLPAPSRLPESIGARAFRRDEGMDDTHDEDDAGEQQQNLGGVVEEKMQRFAQRALPRQTGEAEQEIGEGNEAGVSGDPQHAASHGHHGTPAFATLASAVSASIGLFIDFSIYMYNRI